LPVCFRRGRTLTAAILSSLFELEEISNEHSC
jgi:hypothetical protein